jgi:hypothetical protein
LPPGLTDHFDGGSHVVDTGTPPARDGCVDDAALGPSPDAQGLCGNMFLEVTTDPPNLYFVIDRSGSMAEVVDGRRKYDAVANAAVALARALGSQANVGAAVFPGHAVDPADQCSPGAEVYPVGPGDPIRNGLCGNDGPVTRAFSRAISLPSGVTPSGGTPTAATLTALLPTLAALRGRTFVLLATDGGPNCNLNAVCDATKCILNIEGQPGCTSTTNCCDSKNVPDGPSFCLDDEATKTAVSNLLAKGIKTYVVGIPGSSPYASLLNDLATAGGTARTGMPASYYDVEHISELDDVLASIGATVTSSCHVHLAALPPDSNLVNVYLDGVLVKFGPNGWIWGPAITDDAAKSPTGDAGSDDANADAADARDEPGAPPDPDAGAVDAGVSHMDIDLVGTACDMLNTGKYRRLQVVFGCPTDIPR